MSREYIMLPSAMMPSEIRQTHGALPYNHIPLVILRPPRAVINRTRSVTLLTAHPTGRA